MYRSFPVGETSCRCGVAKVTFKKRHIPVPLISCSLYTLSMLKMGCPKRVGAIQGGGTVIELVNTTPEFVLC